MSDLLAGAVLAAGLLFVLILHRRYLKRGAPNRKSK